MLRRAEIFLKREYIHTPAVLYNGSLAIANDRTLVSYVAKHLHYADIPPNEGEFAIINEVQV